MSVGRKAGGQERRVWIRVQTMESQDELYMKIDQKKLINASKIPDLDLESPIKISLI